MWDDSTALTITDSVTKPDLQELFGGSIPDLHPDWYIDSRLATKQVLVAKFNDENVGFLIYDVWWGNCPFIELIKIKDKHQRKGAGLALLQKVAQQLKINNFKTIISSSEVINEIGNNFHAKAGFTKLNRLLLPHGEEQFFSIEISKLITKGI